MFFYWSVNLFVIGEKGVMFLYFVVKNNFKSVCIKLLDYGVNVDVENKNMLYIFVFENRNDDIVVMLIRKMKKEM